MEKENRYSRHELLKEFDAHTQEKISASKVLIIGAGGLGSPASLYLASSGVGRITIADGDTVDLTNLQRQVIHNMSRIGMNKATSAKASLEAMNSEIDIRAFTHRPLLEELEELIADHDVVLDCTDNTASVNCAADIKSRLLRPARSRLTDRLRFLTIGTRTPPVMPVFSQIMTGPTRRLRLRAYLRL